MSKILAATLKEWSEKSPRTAWRDQHGMTILRPIFLGARDIVGSLNATIRHNRPELGIFARAKNPSFKDIVKNEWV